MGSDHRPYLAKERTSDFANEEERASATHYVMLAEAAELSARAGDLDLSFEAVRRMSECFHVDRVELVERVLSLVPTSSRDLTTLDRLFHAYLELVDEAILRDKYAVAEEAASTALKVAAKAKDSLRSTHARDEVKRVKTVRRRFEDLEEDTRRLGDDPADPAVSAAIGEFLCLYKGDWAAGLPLLAKGSNPSLRSAAQLELETPTETSKQERLGEMWSEVADSADKAVRIQALRRAASWYMLAFQGVSGLATRSIEKRLERIYAAQRQNDINLLRLVDVKRHDVGHGRWKRVGQSVICPKTPRSGSPKLRIPVIPHGDYELEVTFVPRPSWCPIVYLPVGEHLSMVHFGRDRLGLELIRGKMWLENETTCSIPPLAEKGQTVCKFRVVLLPDEEASVWANCNGRPAFRWRGRRRDLSLAPYHRFAGPETLGLAAWHSEVQFTTAKLWMLSGHAELAR